MTTTTGLTTTISRTWDMPQEEPHTCPRSCWPPTTWKYRWSVYVDCVCYHYQLHSSGGRTLSVLAGQQIDCHLISFPFIQQDGNNFHQNGGGATGIGGSDGNASEQHCLFGQVGFRPGHSEYTSNKQAKQQLIVATVICFLFMVSGEIVVVKKQARFLWSNQIWLTRMPSGNSIQFEFKEFPPISRLPN